MTKKFLVNMPLDLYDQVAALALEDDRPINSMVVKLVRVGMGQAAPFNPIKSSPSQTTIPHSDVIDASQPSDTPKKFQLKPQKQKPRLLIPDDIPLRVVMTDVEVVDEWMRFQDGAPHYVCADKILMQFGEGKNKITGEVTITARAVTRFVDVDGDGSRIQVAPSTWIDEWNPKLKDKAGVIARWLGGDYILEEDVNPSELHTTIASGGRIGALPQPLPNITGTFQPSPEQLREYKDRGWDDEGVALFIELRSQVPTAVFDFHDRLVEVNQQVDAFMCAKQGEDEDA